MPLRRHSGRFFHDDQVGILKEDFDVVRVWGGISRLVPDFDDVTRLQLSSFVETQIAVDLYVAIFHQPPHGRPGLARKELPQGGYQGQARPVAR